MAKSIKTQQSFGSVRVDHFSPDQAANWPKGINIHISFEEAMRLHLGLAQILGKLNSYDRSTKAGRRSAVNLCLYRKVRRITINEGRLSSQTAQSNGQTEG